jgi:dienelactone hydrolase
MELQPIPYEAGGQAFTGYLADGSNGGRVPGVLVIHEGGGLGDHTKERAARLADLGYVAFAMDLFGEPGAPIERLREIVQQLRADHDIVRARCRAALAVVRSCAGTDNARLAAIGYCFGGAAAIELARDGADLGCVVGFHSGFITGPPAADDKAIKARVLMCQGAADPVVTAALRDDFAARMEAAGADWQMHLYGGVGHSFTNPAIDAWGLPGFAYDEIADRRSWAAMLALFGEAFDRG